jgi:tetratricopeptide (TPR) repeat protein
MADAGRNALVIAPGTKGIVKIPAFSARENCEIETREVFLASEGPGRVVEKTSARGIAEVVQRSRFTGADPVKLRENLKEYIKNTYRAEALGEVKLSNPLELEKPFLLQLEAVKASGAFTSEKDARVVLNPWPLVTALSQYLQPGDQDPSASRPNAETKPEPKPRRTSLELPHPWSGEMNWILHVPDGYHMEALPQPQTRSFGPATLHMDWRRGEGGTVEAQFRFHCERLLWTPREVDEARAALKAFGEEPSPVIVFQNMGEAHLEAGRLKEAMTEFRGVAERQPQAAAPLVRLAQTQFSAGLVEASRKTLLKAISLDPSAEHPHRQLGWALQHDAMGRRFLDGWDRAGAAAELKKAMELAPGLRMARLDLAILLGHNTWGDWWVSRDMDAVIQLYRDQLARGKDERAQEQLTIALARTGKFPEARASAQLIEAAADRNGWTIALDACLKGADVAIQEAKRSLQDPEVRRKGMQEASGLLMALRRYPEAGAIARECVAGPEAATYQARARLAPRLKPFESVPIDPKTPVGGLLALARATAEPGFDREKAMALLSPAQRPEKCDEATVLKVMAGLHHFRTSSREWRLQKLDEVHSTVDYGIDGTERTGFHIKVPRPNPFPGDVYLSCHEGLCRVVSWGYQPARLGKEALWEAEHGNLDAARAWLDRAMEQVILPTAQDPLSGHPVGHAWSRGRMGSLEEIRLAAALLVLDREPNGPATKIAMAALPSATAPGLRGALLRVLAQHRIQDRKAADRYTAELLSLFPDKPRGPLARARMLVEDKRFEEALLVVRAARKAMPAEESLLIEETRLLSCLGRLGESRALLLQAVREGKETTGILNNLAWNDLCLGQVTEQTEEWAERAAQLSKNGGHFHTLACVQAELGRYTQARASLLESVPAEGPIDSTTWFGLGLIARSLGDLESARAYFGRVDTPENKEDATDPETCKALARKYLLAMGKVQP